jgi:hypothetical protein
MCFVQVAVEEVVVRMELMVVLMVVHQTVQVVVALAI